MRRTTFYLTAVEQAALGTFSTRFTELVGDPAGNLIRIQELP